MLQIINSLATGGAEKLILDSVPEYRDKGIVMEVLVLNGTDHPFLSRLQKSNVVVHALSNGSVYNPLHALRIRRYLKEYDLVHVHLFPALYWTAIAKSLSSTKTKLVFTEHNTSNRRRGWFFKLFDRWAYARYHAIVAITQEVGDKLQVHLGASKEKFHLIHNGIDVATFRDAAPAPRTEFDIPQPDKIVIQVSSFTEQKDQQTLIRAMSKLRTSAQLLLVGTGPLQGSCEQLVRELELDGRVHFLGTRMDVPQLLRMANVVVLSSHFEGLSLSSMEALASGTPFVASRVPGLTQVVEGAGVLFSESNEQELAQAIDNLLEDDQHYAAVSKAGQERATHYDLEKMIDKHYNLYRDLCKSQS
ncbi:MAG: glycosyltransferase [Bacteroidota bacterium]